MSLPPFPRQGPAPVAVAVLGLAVGLVLVSGCQPVEDVDSLDAADSGRTGAEGASPRGAPAGGLPESLSEAVARANEAAAQWQRDVRLAEIVMHVDEEGQLTEGRLTYLAPHADRLLEVEFLPEGMRQDRPTLAALDLSPIPGEAIGALPPLPEGAQGPADLVAAAPDAFAECGVEGTPSTVIYATGAPLAWDPATGVWTLPLDWSATVTTETGAGAVLDPVTATSTECLAPAE